jgi:hypothetical protein
VRRVRRAEEAITDRREVRLDRVRVDPVAGPNPSGPAFVG